VVSDPGLRYRRGDDSRTLVPIVLPAAVGLRPRHQPEGARRAVHADRAMRGRPGLSGGRVLAGTRRRNGWRTRCWPV